ncbi:response regulator [Methylocella sp.]|uniref:response regulator n=1 Tax=Methylocella sp. TaxID=1978226 RepID=UPI0037835DCD
MPQEPARPPLILVVEDEAIVRMFGADLLEAAGFAVIEAADADEALTVLRRRDDVSAVFSDVDMPGRLDGAELAGLIREKWPEIAVVLTSGRGGGGLRGAGAAFVPKPYEADTLLREIRNAVRRSAGGDAARRPSKR